MVLRDCCRDELAAFSRSTSFDAAACYDLDGRDNRKTCSPTTGRDCSRHGDTHVGDFGERILLDLGIRLRR
jgi:hypothetical protein